MNKDIAVSVLEVVGSPLCVASSDGQKVYERIHRAMKHNRGVSLSFRHVSTLTSAFLNAAIGQLYGEFEESEIQKLLNVHDMDSSDEFLLKRVKENAKQYFIDPDRFTRDVREELGTDYDEE